jgi:hypothetical protein
LTPTFFQYHHAPAGWQGTTGSPAIPKGEGIVYEFIVEKNSVKSLEIRCLEKDSLSHERALLRFKSLVFISELAVCMNCESSVRGIDVSEKYFLTLSRFFTETV